MILGFTGSRSGLTREQYIKLNLFFEENKILEVHHGDCIGSDEIVHNLSMDKQINIIIHPPVKRIYRAFCESNFTLTEKDYLVRNRDIVNSSDMIIAFPPTYKKIPRSGTWYTINYAKKCNKTCLTVFPDGKSVLE